MKAPWAALVLAVWAGAGLAQTASPPPTADETPAPGLPISLMFGPEEMAEIDKARKRRPGTAAPERRETPAASTVAVGNVYLSALMYFNPKRWTAWINGIQFGPGSSTDILRVIGAAPDHVDLEVEMPDRPPLRLRLAPNQTYLAAEGRVIEGILP